MLKILSGEWLREVQRQAQFGGWGEPTQHELDEMEQRTLFATAPVPEPMHVPLGRTEWREVPFTRDDADLQRAREWEDAFYRNDSSREG